MIEVEVVDFVKENLWEPKGGLTLESRLFHDLGVDGDDGVEFMVKFCSEFGVPPSQIEISKHFGPEAGPTPLSLLRWIFDKNFRKGKDLIPIRLKDLIESAEKKTWNINY